jgi:protein SCO1
MRTLVSLSLCVLLGVLLAGCASPLPGATTAEEPNQGTPVEPPVALTDFTLPSSRDGAPLSLSDLAGTPTLLFFGYTFCPDVCPLTLSEMKRTKELLGADGARLNVVFVSVDPARDTPEVLARYVTTFDPSFIGLQGDEATLRRIGKEYGLYYKQNTPEGTSAAYLVDHSAASYLIDGNGQLRMLYGYGTPPDVLADGVRTLLAEG